MLRDAETHDLVREIMALRYGPGIAKWHEALSAGLNAKQRVMLTLALSFHTWRTLAREGGLKKNAAVTTMAQAIAA
ncbi:hypothetical protein D3C83_153800 [compost metagenome]